MGRKLLLGPEFTDEIAGIFQPHPVGDLTYRQIRGAKQFLGPGHTTTGEKFQGRLADILLEHPLQMVLADGKLLGQGFQEKEVG